MNIVFHMGGGLFFGMQRVLQSRPPQPPRLLFRPAKSASEPKKLIETHRVSIVFHMGGAGNRVSIVFHMGGAAPPPTPPLFFRHAKSASEAQKLVETHRVNIVFHMGGGLFVGTQRVLQSRPPPTPPLVFKACDECCRA